MYCYHIHSIIASFCRNQRGQNTHTCFTHRPLLQRYKYTNTNTETKCIDIKKNCAIIVCFCLATRGTSHGKMATAKCIIHSHQGSYDNTNRQNKSKKTKEKEKKTIIYVSTANLAAASASSIIYLQSNSNDDHTMMTRNMIMVMRKESYKALIIDNFFLSN